MELEKFAQFVNKALVDFTDDICTPTMLPSNTRPGATVPHVTFNTAEEPFVVRLTLFCAVILADSSMPLVSVTSVTTYADPKIETFAVVSTTGAAPSEALDKSVSTRDFNPLW
jgi:hypothetical protein